MQIYKHSATPNSPTIRFVIEHEDKCATVLITSLGHILTNDIAIEWAKATSKQKDKLGYIPSNPLELLVLTGVTKQDIEGLLQ